MMNRICIRTIFWILCVSVALIWFCYHYVDQSISEIAYYDNWRRFAFLKWLTYLAPLFLILSLISIAYTTIRRCFQITISKTEHTIFIASLNTLVTSQITPLLKFIFGRTWPATWIHNNPSWLQNHVYGFHFFHGGKAYASFPSGHTAIVFAMITVLWLGLPKWRWLCAVLGISIVAGLIGMYYHFVSDVIVGATLGILTGYITTFAFLPKKIK